MRLLATIALGLGIATTAQAAEPGPIWGVFPGTTLDRSLSQTYYAVAEGAFSRIPTPGERPEQKGRLDAVAREALLVYLQRVDNMIAGMNLPDEIRQPYCAKMLEFVSDEFVHIEGRRRVQEDGAGGFAVRTKAQLAAACQNRAFRMRGFYAIRSRVVVMSPDQAQVTTCYLHDQWNDPTVRGTRQLPGGTFAVFRTSVETIQRQPDGKMRITNHVAIDSDEETVMRGCAVR